MMGSSERGTEEGVGRMKKITPSSGGGIIYIMTLRFIRMLH